MLGLDYLLTQRIRNALLHQVYNVLHLQSSIQGSHSVDQGLVMMLTHRYYQAEYCLPLLG